MTEPLPTDPTADEDVGPAQNPIDEATRNNIISTFLAILRTGQLHGQVTAQRASLAMHTLLMCTEAGTPVHLAALAHFLRENKAPESGIVEAMVVLKSREARFAGVTFALPESCAGLSPEQIQAIGEAFTDKAERAERTERANVEAKRQAVEQEAKEASDEALGIATPSKKTKPQLNSTQKLSIALALGVVGLLASVSYLQSQKGPSTTKLSFPKDASVLPCADDSPPMSNATGRCVIPKAFYDQKGEAKVQALAESTKRALRPQSVSRLMVFTDDGKVRYIVR